MLAIVLVGARTHACDPHEISSTHAARIERNATSAGQRSIERADLAMARRGIAHSAVSIVEGNTPAKSASCSRNTRHCSEQFEGF